MSKECSACNSTNFRLSTLRSKDILRLILLMYPLRCKECLRRSFTFLPLAWKYRKS